MAHIVHKTHHIGHDQMAPGYGARQGVFTNLLMPSIVFESMRLVYATIILDSSVNLVRPTFSTFIDALIFSVATLRLKCNLALVNGNIGPLRASLGDPANRKHADVG